jgi:hypothetical protein
MIGTRVAAMVPRWLKHSALVAAPVRRSLQVMTRGLERVIFTATTGRSGTMTLSTLFSMVPGCAAFHEPHPFMNGSVLKAASQGDEAFVDRAYARVKSVNILRAALGHRYYMESNQLFVKTFIRQAFDEFGDRMAVVHLVRSPVDVAMSLYRLQQIPGTEVAEIWWLDHRAPTNIIQIADLLESDAEFSHPFYRALWYWYEVETRFAAWRARLPSMKVVHFDTDWFNDRPRVLRLLDELGLDYERSKIESLIMSREHTKSDLKTLPALGFPEADQKDRRFQQLLAARGLDLSAIRYRSNAPWAPDSPLVAQQESG